MALVYGSFEANCTSSLSAYPVVTTGSGVIKLTPLAEEMLSYFPSYYQDGENIRKLTENISIGLQEGFDDLDEVKRQFFLDTATFGLKWWEQYVRLAVQEHSTDYAARRIRVKNKLTSGQSELVFKEGLEAITGTPIVLELLDPSEYPYQFTVEARSQLYEDGPSTAPSVSTYGSGVLSGDYTYKVTYEFPSFTVLGGLGIAPYDYNETAAEKTNDVQTLTVTGSPVSGTFTLEYTSNTIDPGNGYTTGAINWDATANDIQTELELLANMPSGAVSVSGGPVGIEDITITFIGSESGIGQFTLVPDNTLLVGGSVIIEHTVTGVTSYNDVASSTLTASNQRILLDSISIGPAKTVKRNIYRKKDPEVFNTYRYIGSINDNINTSFVDNVSDESVSDIQRITIEGVGTYELTFDGSETAAVLTETSTNSDFETALEALTTTNFTTIDVSTVSGEIANQTGIQITFDGGDVLGQGTPLIEVTSITGTISAQVEREGPRYLPSTNSGFTDTFEQLATYIWRSKPAHLHCSLLRSGAFRASINSAGDPV